MDFNETPEQTGQTGQTGQPGYDQPVYGQQPYEQPTYEQPTYGAVPPKPDKNTVVLLVVCFAVVLVLGIGAIVAAATGMLDGLFGGKSAKVAKAFVNTFSEQPMIVEDLSAADDIFTNGQYTATLDLYADNLDIGLEYRVFDQDKQFAGDIGSGFTKIEFTGALTEDELMLNIPVIGDYNFCYNYHEIGSGYLFEDMSEEEIQVINKGLELLYDPKTADGEEVTMSLDGWIESFADSLKETEFEDAETETFEIDGKEVECKGYQTTLKQEEMEAALDFLEEEYYAQNEELYKIMLEADPYFEIPYQEIFDDTRLLIEELSDINLKFYIYKNQLAAIVVETQEDGQLRLCFKGGDRRTQNMVLELFEDYGDGTTATTELLAITGDITGSTETMTLELEQMDAIVFTYDSETGKYELDVADGELFFAGEVAVNRTSIYIYFDEFLADGEDMDMEVHFFVKKGSYLEEIEGERFDIGNADEDEWDDLANDVMNSMYGY